MTKLILVTGLFGAGKTTFLRRLAPMYPEDRIEIIVNGYGRCPVDGMTLSRLGHVTRINGESAFSKTRTRRFQEILTGILEQEKPSLILMEGSGQTDPCAAASFFQAMAYPDLVYAGAVCLVDASTFADMYEDHDELCRRQIEGSRVVVLNKTDLAMEDELEAARALIQERKAPDTAVYESVYAHFDRSLLREISPPAGEIAPWDPPMKYPWFNKYQLSVMDFDYDAMLGYLNVLCSTATRVKGFVTTAEGVTYLADCCGRQVKLRRYDGKVPEGNDRLDLIYHPGVNIEIELQEAGTWYPECLVQVE